MEKEKTLRETIASMLATQALDLAAAAGFSREASAPAAASSVAGRLRALQADAERLTRWNDPRGVYAHCLCGEE